MNRLLLNNTEISGCSWSVLATAPGGLPAAAKQLDEMATAGNITPVVTATYPLAEGARALQAIDDRSVTGKAVLLPD